MDVEHYDLATDLIGGEVRPSMQVRDGELEVEINGWEWSSIDTVWNRRIMINPGWSTPPATDLMVEKHIHDQNLAMVDGLLAALAPSCRWMNGVDVRLARSKTAQLHLATQLGIPIPPTLVSSNPEQIRSFAFRHSHTGVITKLIAPTPSRVPNGEEQFTIFTTRINPEKVDDGSLSAAPAIYQPVVTKVREARAIVVGDEVICCAFDSQLSEQTNLDWRRYDFDAVPHYPIQLPKRFASQLIKLTAELGLVYSAVDVAELEDGSWLMFELNPSGQWAWLELVGAAPIGRMVASWLAAK